jgi:cell division protein FtsL
MGQKKGFVLQVFLCLMLFSICWFSYLEKQNELTELRIYVPKLVKEIKYIQEENTRLKYQIEQFENPERLMKMASETRFSHLKHPLNKEILVLQEAVALELPSQSEKESVPLKPKLTLAVGAK